MRLTDAQCKHALTLAQHARTLLTPDHLVRQQCFVSIHRAPASPQAVAGVQVWQHPNCVLCVTDDDDVVIYHPGSWEGELVTWARGEMPSAVLGEADRVQLTLDLSATLLADAVEEERAHLAVGSELSALAQVGCAVLRAVEQRGTTADMQPPVMWGNRCNERAQQEGD